jgi:peptide subunit release factor 1 (eRF1)
MISSELIKKISVLRSSINGTDLLTLYIPPNYSLSLVSESITTELGTASNIKDKNVRKSVISSLKSCQQTIKSCKYNKAPENGLVLLANDMLVDDAKYYV